MQTRELSERFECEKQFGIVVGPLPPEPSPEDTAQAEEKAWQVISCNMFFYRFSHENDDFSVENDDFLYQNRRSRRIWPRIFVSRRLA